MGTLFLDEVSDLSLSAQAKLLRAVQDLSVERVGGTGSKRVNTRIVAATNRPLSGLVEKGLFRADLYYRLSGVEIHVPPLRERRDDVTELARYFLARHGHMRELSLSDGALDALRLHRWPGNVRELERVIERAVALAESDHIELDDLPPQVRGEYAEVLAPSLARAETMRAWGSRYAGSCSNAAAATKRRPAVCSTSATTRCRRTCGSRRATAAGLPSRCRPGRGCRRARAGRTRGTAQGVAVATVLFLVAFFRAAPPVTRPMVLCCAATAVVGRVAMAAGVAAEPPC
jgi:transcriptional regulator with GAF, ATPase, and Fis domain